MITNNFPCSPTDLLPHLESTTEITKNNNHANPPNTTTHYLTSFWYSPEAHKLLGLNATTFHHQYNHARSLGVFVLYSPKSHCEIVGEGVEFLWACSKTWYCREPSLKKLGKDSFKNVVHMSIGRDIISIERMRLFGQRQQHYILAYLALHDVKVTKEEEIEKDKKVGEDSPKMTCSLIENIVVKKFCEPHKSHRSIADQDVKFINEILSNMRVKASKTE